ncbi:hypothetical protein Droror1_Dr00013387 [Drosera rotundifolia]
MYSIGKMAAVSVPITLNPTPTTAHTSIAYPNHGKSHYKLPHLHYATQTIITKMNKQLSNLIATLAIVAITFVIFNPAVVVDGVACSVYELAPCAGAILSSSAPSSACCSKLQEQKPCLCGYYKDPNLAQYVNSPAAKKVSSACGVAVKC